MSRRRSRGHWPRKRKLKANVLKRLLFCEICGPQTEAEAGEYMRAFGRGSLIVKSWIDIQDGRMVGRNLTICHEGRCDLFPGRDDNGFFEIDEFLDFTTQPGWLEEYGLSELWRSKLAQLGNAWWEKGMGLGRWRLRRVGI